MKYRQMFNPETGKTFLSTKTMEKIIKALLELTPSNLLANTNGKILKTWLMSVY